MSGSLVEGHAEELRDRVHALAVGVDHDGDVVELRAAAHKLRGAALVLGLDGVAVATAAYEAALADEADLDSARRAAILARAELERVLEPDPLRPLRHDLRNDVAVVLMASKLLEEELADPGQRELAAKVAGAAERMAAALVELRTSDPRLVLTLQAGTDHATPLSVLVVDDDELVAELIRQTLAVSGARVDAVPGLEAARLAIAESDYAAAVVDLHLIDGEGAELVAELRRRGTRVVVLSGDGGSAVEGADVSLSKPVESSVLLAAVTGATR